MKQEFEMTQEEMDNIVAINDGGGDPVMFLSGGAPMGESLQEKINQYWEILGAKYEFKPLTVEGSGKGKLFFLAESKEKVIPKTQSQIEIDKYIGHAKGYLNYNVTESLAKIVTQLKGCNYECEGGVLVNNVAFIALERLSKIGQ